MFVGDYLWFENFQLMYLFAVSMDNVRYYSIDGQHHGIKLHFLFLKLFFSNGLIETTGHFIRLA